MSAPCSSGRQRYGVASVASIASGTPAAWAIAPSDAMSAIVPAGLAMISVYSSFVRPGYTAASNAAGSSGGTNVVSIPSRRSVTSSSVYVPP
jgi:hypothetical protein